MINIFDDRYNQIVLLKEENNDCSEEVLIYIREKLNHVLREWDNLDLLSRKRISEEVAEIPLRLFSIEEVPVKEEIEKIVFELISLESSENLNDDEMYSIINKTYKKLLEFDLVFS